MVGFKARRVGWKKCKEFKIRKKLEGEKLFESFRNDRRITHKPRPIVMAKRSVTGVCLQSRR